MTLDDIRREICITGANPYPLRTPQGAFFHALGETIRQHGEAKLLIPTTHINNADLSANKDLTNE